MGRPQAQQLIALSLIALHCIELNADALVKNRMVKEGRE